MSELNPQDELTTLKERATLMKLPFHPSIGVAALREKIRAHLADEPPVPDEVITPDPVVADPVVPAAPAAAAAPAPETPMQKLQRQKLEAERLVRIRLQCMNPAKKEWDGEIITVGNNTVGTIRKYVPFNAEDGWHVTHIMYEALRDRQCQTFVNERSKNGVTVRKGKLIREFAIEIMPDLTQKELDDLAQRQAMANGTSSQ